MGIIEFTALVLSFEVIYGVQRLVMSVCDCSVITMCQKRPTQSNRNICRLIVSPKGEAISDCAHGECRTFQIICL